MVCSWPMLSKNTLFQLAFAVGERFGADLGWNRPLSEEDWLRSCSMTRALTEPADPKVLVKTAGSTVLLA